jgi:hypothetical protein
MATTTAITRPFEGLLPLPYLDQDAFDEGNWAEIRRLKGAGHAVYVRKLSDGTYEIVDGGKIDSSASPR